jgi:hypothetical protein
MHGTGYFASLNSQAGSRVTEPVLVGQFPPTATQPRIPTAEGTSPVYSCVEVTISPVIGPEPCSVEVNLSQSGPELRVLERRQELPL